MALLDPLTVTKTVSARNYSLPNKYLKIHAYHKDINLLTDLMVLKNLEHSVKTKELKEI